MLVVHQRVEVANEQAQQPRTLAGDCHCRGEGVALLTIVLLDIAEQCGLTLSKQISDDILLVVSWFMQRSLTFCNSLDFTISMIPFKAC
jgi:hypothetical protein